MKRILVTGAGGAPALNFIRSLRMAPEPFHLIGADCSKYSLARAATDERHLVPKASDQQYIPVLRRLIQATGAEMVYAQPDPEVAVLSERRDELGARTFLPAPETVRRCQDKFQTYVAWQAAGLRVPETRLITTVDDLRAAFEAYGDPWLRPVTGAAGRGALHARGFEQARLWLEFNQGWGSYTAARYLSPESVTWQSIWNRGELVVAQSRRRLYWEFADRAPSGVTGITGAAVTVADPALDEIAQRAILAVDPQPHGVFSVDLTYDADGVPNPTEINIGRFFTTHLFFTMAGLNMPYLVVKLAFGEELPALPVRVNPLPEGLLWIRGMDMEPVLTDVRTVDGFEQQFRSLAAALPVPEGR
ncbi:MAG TPA: carboxylate--amine ligase [Dehalococcoidia bacterium]